MALITLCAFAAPHEHRARLERELNARTAQFSVTVHLSVARGMDLLSAAVPLQLCARMRWGVHLVRSVRHNQERAYVEFRPNSTHLALRVYEVVL